MPDGDAALTAASYQGLADATFSIGDLVAAANVGSLEELLALELAAPEYLNLLADALSDGGDSSAAATLNALAGAADEALPVALADVLDIATGVEDDVFDTRLNAFDMLDVGAQVARGDAAIALDTALDLPGVNSSVKLRVIQAP